jgi:hypothetical protein
MSRRPARVSKTDLDRALAAAGPSRAVRIEPDGAITILPEGAVPTPQEDIGRQLIPSAMHGFPQQLAHLQEQSAECTCHCQE